MGRYGAIHGALKGNLIKWKHKMGRCKSQDNIEKTKTNQLEIPLAVTGAVEPPCSVTAY